MSTADLAKAAGISEPALYRYFSGKKDLFLSTLKTPPPSSSTAGSESPPKSTTPSRRSGASASSYYDHLKSHSAVMKLQFQALVEADDPEIRAGAAPRTTRRFVDFFAERARGRQEARPRAAGRRQRAPSPGSSSAWGSRLDASHLLGFDGDMTPSESRDLDAALHRRHARRPSRREARRRIAAAFLHEHIPAVPPPLEGIPS